MRRRDVERQGNRVSFLHASRRTRRRKREAEKEKERRDEERRRISSTAGRRRARTAVVNGNNCCGRCHSKARVPNARCQMVVRVITVITSYRDTHTLCTIGPTTPMHRRIDATASFSHLRDYTQQRQHLRATIVRFALDSIAIREKCCSDRRRVVKIDDERKKS